MKSVGEAMAIAEPFRNRSRNRCARWKSVRTVWNELDPLLDKDARARSSCRSCVCRRGARLVYRRCVPFRHDLDEIFALTFIDPWFLAQLEELVLIEGEIVKSKKRIPSAERLRAWKRKVSPTGGLLSC